MHKVAVQDNESTQAGDSKSQVSAGSQSETKSKSRVSGTAKTMKSMSTLESFHHEFMQTFFQFCPDIKAKFPNDFILVAKMIKSFISKLVKGTDVKVMAKEFAKTHMKYNLKKEHFDGFGAALVKTIQNRLGRFGTIKLIGIWRRVVEELTSIMHTAYVKREKA